MRWVVVGLLVLELGGAVACRGKATPPPAPAAAVAPAPGGAAEIPAYPGASQVGYKERGRGDGYTRKVEATYVTTDALPQVKAFYQRAVADGGWTVTEFEEKPTEVKWKLVRGLAEAKVELEVERPGTVSIDIERKDR